MQKILIIQTAFIGDVVLATSMVEKIKKFLPSASIDILVRQGNESLLQNNPNINEVLIWNKKQQKTKNLFKILKQIRQTKYDKVINVQRFFATGILTAFSNAKEKIGFNKNPLSFFFTKKIKHQFTTTPPFKHEVERNNELIKNFTDESISLPKLYPSIFDEERVMPYTTSAFVTLSPSSVWFTKQLPIKKWAELIEKLPPDLNIYLLGGKENKQECDELKNLCPAKKIINLAGELNFLQSAALMKKAQMNYVNDSAPLHFASAVNATVTAFFCSTIPAFGYTPLSTKSFISQIDEKITCRPCGIHGKKTCPQQHFKCGYNINMDKAIANLAK